MSADQPATDDALRLSDVQVLRIRGEPGCPWAKVELTGQGSPAALAALNQFFACSWLTLDSPYLHDLAHMTGREDAVSLREDGWAMRETSKSRDGTDDGASDWVRVAASFGEADALLRWPQWLQVLHLLNCFLCLQQRYPSGEPRYSADQGFRVRLHA